MKKLTLILTTILIISSCNNTAIERLEDESVLSKREKIQSDNSLLLIRNDIVDHVYYKNIHYIQFREGNCVNYTKDSFEFEEMMRKEVNSNLFENHSSLSLVNDSIITFMPRKK